MEPINTDKNLQVIPIYAPLPFAGYGHAISAHAIPYLSQQKITLFVTPFLNGTIIKECMQQKIILGKIFYSVSEYPDPAKLLDTIRKQTVENNSYYTDTVDDAAHLLHPTPYNTSE